MFKINVKSETRVSIENPTSFGYYDITIEENSIRIRKSGFLSDQIVIYPKASNTITIL